MTSEERSFPVFSLLYNLFAIPYNFFFGFVVGVAAPVAAIAAMVLGVRFLTGKMPFLSLRQEEEDERHLSIDLVSPEVAGDLYTAEKEKIMSELGSFRDEIKGMIEEAKAAAEKSGAAEGATAEAA
jgi:hypothetical protein